LDAIAYSGCECKEVGVLSNEQQAPSVIRLSFRILEKHFKEVLDVEQLTDDSLKCLGLMDRQGYNSVAELLSDDNEIPNAAFEVYSFAKGYKKSIVHRISLLSQLDIVLGYFNEAYPIDASVKYVPYEAFREAIINAMLYRDYHVEAPIIVDITKDGAVIKTPGGLPEGISNADFINGQVSIMRNITLAEIFYKLKIIGRLGTGINVITDAYTESASKPTIVVDKSYISFFLPAIKSDEALAINSIMNLLYDGRAYTIKELSKKVGFPQSTLHTALESLESQKKLSRVGTGRNAKYLRAYEQS
jgi:ATP-dependent DNA helicase RecG